MTRLCLALLTALALAAGPARADFILDPLPAEYTPGQSFEVSIGLGPVQNLGLYNLELVFQTTGPVAGTLAVGPVTPAGSGYVFPATDFFLATPFVSGNEYRVAISDFTLDNPGVDVLAGVNDRITAFTVTTLPAAAGPIRVFVDETASFLDDADGNPIPLGSFPSFVIDPSVGPPAPVPAPPGIVCAGIGAVALSGRRLAVRRRATA